MLFLVICIYNRLAGVVGKSWRGAMKECQQEWKWWYRKQWESSSVVLLRDSGAEKMLCNLRRLCLHQTAWQLNWLAWSHGSAFSCNKWMDQDMARSRSLFSRTYVMGWILQRHAMTTRWQFWFRMRWKSIMGHLGLLRPLTSLTQTLQCNEPRSFFLLLYRHSAERDL